MHAASIVWWGSLVLLPEESQSSVVLGFDGISAVPVVQRYHAQRGEGSTQETRTSSIHCYIALPVPTTQALLARHPKQARRWNHPSEKGPARRFLSHLLTYPLTLAVGLHEAGLGFPAERDPAVSTANSRASAGPDCNSTVKKKMAGHHHVAVVCIGARAESTLPPSFWRETLFALPGVSGLDLHLIGPELSLPAGLAPATESGNPTGGSLATVHVGDRTADLSWTRAVLRHTTGTCVGVTQGEADEGEGVRAEAAANAAAGAIADRAVARADAFVLFNPGLGHPHLREGWEGAAERLIASGKPIIVSCHSQVDLERDARRLSEIGERCYGEGWATGRGVEIFPRKNAFCSLMVSENPLSKPGAEELVSSNWGLLVVRGGAQGRDEDAAVDRGRI